jgi:Neuraminidase (sialidase)
MSKTKLRIAIIISTLVAIFIANYVMTSSSSNAKPEQMKHSQHAEQSGVVSLDVKYVDGIVHLLLGKHENDENNIWYQSSVDQGVTWSEPVKVTNEVSTSPKFKRGNDARFAVQGNNIIAVSMTEKEGVRFNAGPMMAMRSSDLGQTWHVTNLPADWQGAHGFFALDANDESINLVWLDSREQKVKGSQGLRFSQSRDGGQSWTPNITLDDLTCACCWNTTRFDNDGNFYVLYRDKQPSDMAIGRLDTSLSWQRLATVGEFKWNFEGCPHIGGGLTVVPTSQQFHATVSTGKTDKAGLYYLSSDDKGSTWSSPVQFGDSSAIYSDIAVSNQGILLSAWDQLSENGLQIIYSSSLDGGKTWSEPEVLSKPDLSATHPRVIAMQDNFLVLWTEVENEGLSELRTATLPLHP